MILLKIEYVPGREIEALGLVKGTVVQSKNFGKDFMAGMKTIVGGEIKGYTEMLIEARQIATKRMVDDAEALGADAVVGLRYGSASVMQGAAEVIAYGTAVKFKGWLSPFWITAASWWSCQPSPCFLTGGRARFRRCRPSPCWCAPATAIRTTLTRKSSPWMTAGGTSASCWAGASA